MFELSRRDIAITVEHKQIRVPIKLELAEGKAF
jgi:hypothetical protein